MENTSHFEEKMAVMSRLFKGFCLAASIGMAAWTVLVWGYTKIFEED